MAVPARKMAKSHPSSLSHESPSAHMEEKTRARTTSVLVSIIVPCHNVAGFVDDLLPSILQQTHRPLEVSFYNDGSTDATQRKLTAALKDLSTAGIGCSLTCELCWENAQATHSTAAVGDASPHPFSLPALAADTTEVFEQRVYCCTCTNVVAARGISVARNRAVATSRGKYLCFLDADDIMQPERVTRQVKAISKQPDSIVGTQFTRVPEDSTPRYTRWANEMSDVQLVTHRFKDCTLIQPTWMLSRRMFDLLGGYPLCEAAEDLRMLLKHYELFVELHGNGLTPVQFDSQLVKQHAAHDPVRFTPADASTQHNSGGGKVQSRSELDAQYPSPFVLVREPLVIYRFGFSSQTHRVSKELLREVRVEALCRQVLCHPPWNKGFAIWGAGKYGRALFRTLPKEFQTNVTAFFDIADKKVGTMYTYLGTSGRKVEQEVPIRHVSELTSPFITCVSMDRGTGFEERVIESNMVEGVDFYYFG
eukprot:m.252533 g.252533  ORF g.252533 m.252533 type:complete len:479 (-) comp15473_c4_seq1:82-1518(-)